MKRENIKFYNQERCPFCGERHLSMRINKTIILECVRCKVVFFGTDKERLLNTWNTRFKPLEP